VFIAFSDIIKKHDTFSNQDIDMGVSGIIIY